MRTVPLLAIVPWIAIGSFALLSPAESPSCLPLEKFVEREYIDGFPWEKATQYGPKDVPALLEMLKLGQDDPKAHNRTYLANVVATLCATGDTRAIAPLMKFAVEGREDVSAEVFDAKGASLLYLGRMYRANKDERIIPFLRKFVEGDPSQMVRYPLDQERLFLLIDSALEGLVDTGAPEAAAVLRQLQGHQSPFPTLSDKNYRDSATDHLKDAIRKMNEKTDRKKTTGNGNNSTSGGYRSTR